jgi:hypothetical protein
MELSISHMNGPTIRFEKTDSIRHGVFVILEILDRVGDFGMQAHMKG